MKKILLCFGFILARSINFCQLLASGKIPSNQMSPLTNLKSKESNDKLLSPFSTYFQIKNDILAHCTAISETPSTRACAIPLSIHVRTRSIVVATLSPWNRSSLCPTTDTQKNADAYSCGVSHSRSRTMTNKFQRKQLAG